LTADRSYQPLSTWAAYILLAGCAIGLLIGFFWYWVWFAQRGAGHLYLLGMSFLIGIGLWSASIYFKPDAPPCWQRPCAEPSYLPLILGLSVACLVSVPVVYGAWRLFKLAVLSAFRILLSAVSQVGAAWRGEIPRRTSARGDT